jgi:hypothetical protein
MTRLLTADEVAERLGVTKDWVWAQAGRVASRMSNSAATGAFARRLWRTGSLNSKGEAPQGAMVGPQGKP